MRGRQAGRHASLGSEAKTGEEGKGKGLGESQHIPGLPASPSFSLSFLPLGSTFSGRELQAWECSPGLTCFY